MTSHPLHLPVAARLQLRNHLLNKIRVFMEQRHIQEVQTPIQMPQTAGQGQALLRTGLDVGMQALLAQGSNDIYQTGQVFRDELKGRKHWPEFSLLCWWRQIGLHTQMQELTDLVAWVCGSEACPADHRSYKQAFVQRLELDPYLADLKTLKEAASRLGVRQRCGDDRQAWLDLLFAQFIEPTLGYDTPLLLTGLPLAKMPGAQWDDSETGEATLSFAFYIDGLKLASGQQCLLPGEKPGVYTGVNVGLDRLAMLLADVRRIEHVLILPD